MSARGFGPSSMQSFDRCARLVASALGTPLALVSIVEGDQLVLPGAAGLPAEVENRRCVALSQSFCQYVVKDGLPLVVDDARSDERLSEHPVLGDLGVVAYAGFPLTDGEGHVVGALCAIDHERRTWTDDDLAALDDLAHLCSREIRLHEVLQDAAGARQRARAVSAGAQLLLELSEVLSDTLTTADVGSAVDRAASLGLGCRHAGIWLRSDRNAPMLHRVVDPRTAWEWAETHPQLPVTAEHPVSRVYRSGAALYLAEEAAALVPLMVAGETIGVLVLTWDAPDPFLDADRDTIAAVALYAAQAVHRANLLDERMGAASAMQRALLSALPAVPGLELGARYRAAVANDHVGGDWYDATELADGSVALMIGDVIGHDIHAAAAMGQLRSMLRAFAWALDDSPSSNVTRLDRAARDLSVSKLASLVYARLDGPEPVSGRRRLRWTNAGHLPPLLVDRTGHVRVLTDGRPADMILGVAPDTDRRDQQTDLDPGDTVVFFTDGLIERREEFLTEGVQRLSAALERYHARPVEELLDSVLAEVVGTVRADDLAVLAVRIV